MMLYLVCHSCVGGSLLHSHNTPLRYMDQLEWLDMLPSLMDGRYPGTLEF